MATSSNSSDEANSRSEISAEFVSSMCHGGEPDDLKTPEAGAVSTSGEEILLNDKIRTWEMKILSLNYSRR